MYCKCTEIEDARKVFDEMTSRNAVVWTSMIVGFTLNNRPREALYLFKQSLALSGDEEEDGAIDVVSAVAVLSACSRISERRLTSGIHGLLVRIGLDGDVGVGNTLVDAYAKSGDLGLLRQVFDEMTARDAVSWNSLISAYAQNGRTAEALDAFSDMFNRGTVEHNATTLSTVLFVCAQAGTLHFGRCIHNQVTELSSSVNFFSFS